MNDFIFGSITAGAIPGEHCFKMESAASLAATASQKYFTGQLSRAVKEYGTDGRLVFFDSSTRPYFAPILLQLNDEDVGLIRISPQENRRHEPHAPLRCEVYLDSGIVEFRSGWSVYGRDRVRESVESMLSPLCFTRLLRKTYIGARLCSTKASPGSLVKDLLELIGESYPSDLTQDDIDYILQHIGAALTFDAQQHKAELSGDKQERFRKLLRDTYASAEKD